MKFNIHGSKVLITPAIKDYVKDKVGRLDKYFENPDDITANVCVKVKDTSQKIEVTILTPKFILRSEEDSKDLYSSIDTVSDKLERQIRKNKTRLKKQTKSDSHIFNFDYKTNDEEEDTKKIVKRKVIDNKPMSEEEAILQMNLLGHPFFVYFDSDTKEIAVIYKRKDGNYGVIETK